MQKSNHVQSAAEKSTDEQNARTFTKQSDPGRPGPDVVAQPEAIAAIKIWQTRLAGRLVSGSNP